YYSVSSCLLTPRPPATTLFPYTTLFRSEEGLVKIAASGGKRRQQSGAVERRVGRLLERNSRAARLFEVRVEVDAQGFPQLRWTKDRKSTRLNSSHVKISYAVFCLKKKKT